MAYKGFRAPIPLGQEGLQTDLPANLIPANSAIVANNIYLHTNRVEKSPGTLNFNPTALPAAIVCAFDWWPTPTVQRTIALTADGKLWRDTGDGTFSSSVPIATGLGALSPDCHMVAAGAEVAGNPRKLFIFTGGVNQVKVLTGDGTTIRNITTPAADWSSMFPTFGIVHNGALWAFGNSNAPHFVYRSTDGDHENFTAAPTSADPAAQFNIYPGEGDRLTTVIDYRGRLYFAKKPFGVYYLDDSTGLANVQIKKFTDAMGAASPHCILQVLSDVYVATSAGSYVSLSAAQTYGDILAGDILALTKTANYIRNTFDSSGINFTQCIYYAQKKIAYFSARLAGTSQQNAMLIVDVNLDKPRLTIETKDQPTCLFLKKDSFGVDRPCYGNDQGFICLMDQNIASGALSAYTGEFQTPFTDFSFIDQQLADKNKLFDFLTVSYVPTGSWAFFVDVYLDGTFSETLIFNQTIGAALDHFVLDRDRLGSNAAQTLRLPLHGLANRISLRVYNSNFNQNFSVEQFIVSFRVSAEQSTSR